MPRKDLHLPDYYHWDTWFALFDGVWHAFHLRADRSLDPDDRHDHAYIGLSTSSDLVTWEDQGTILTPGAEGEWDDLALWTGSIIRVGGVYYLYYTGRNREHPLLQRIGLAVSKDLKLWHKHPGNPLLVPKRPYSARQGYNPVGGGPAWRDGQIVPMPDGTYAMLVTARTLQTVTFNACIAVALSSDLVHWSLKKPLLAPYLYDEMECPQLLEHDGRYYLFFSVKKRHYNPIWVSRLGGSYSGLHCFVSDSLFGQYRPANGTGVVMSGEATYDVRLLPETRDGSRYKAIGFLDQGKDTGFVGTLSPPMTIIVEGDSVTADLG